MKLPDKIVYIFFLSKYYILEVNVNSLLLEKTPRYKIIYNIYIFKNSLHISRRNDWAIKFLSGDCVPINAVLVFQQGFPTTWRRSSPPLPVACLEDNLSVRLSQILSQIRDDVAEKLQNCEWPFWSGNLFRDVVHFFVMG